VDLHLDAPHLVVAQDDQPVVGFLAVDRDGELAPAAEDVGDAAPLQEIDEVLRDVAPVEDEEQLLRVSCQFQDIVDVCCFSNSSRALFAR